MDGVIVNSNPVHRQAWDIYNRRYGIETTDAMHRRMYGKRNDQIVRDFFGAGFRIRSLRRTASRKRPCIGK